LLGKLQTIIVYSRLSVLFSISVLAISLSFDIQLPNGQTTRHPNVNKFIDNVRVRLNQAIRICEKTPLGKIILFI